MPSWGSPLKGERARMQDGDVRKGGQMELPESGYFYTLAQVGITFSGFSALLLAVQQMRGIGLSGFHKWVAKIYIVSGMVTATNAMLPPLLYGLGLSEDLTWRI